MLDTLVPTISPQSKNASASSFSEDLELTGERYVPFKQGTMRLEHLHRYALAQMVARGKTVLDIACGEGYGSHMMAQTAQQVYGVDVDIPTVQHATNRYQVPHLSFLVGSADAIPLPNDSVQVVVSFETIEHHDRHEQMMAEIRRVLRPGGFLLLSSPNKLIYTDQANYKNPFHVKELYRDELLELAGRHFAHVQLYGQNVGLGSFVYPIEGYASTNAQTALPLLLERTSERIDTQASDSASVYYLVVCSDTPVSFTVASAHANPEHDALQSEMHEYKQAMTTLSEQNAYVGTLQSYIEDRENHLQQAHQKMGELHEKASTLEHRTLHLDSIVSGKQEEIASLQEEITSLNGQLSTLTGERDSLRDRLNRIEASLPYRVYRKLRGLTGTSGSQA